MKKAMISIALIFILLLVGCQKSMDFENPENLSKQSTNLAGSVQDPEVNSNEQPKLSSGFGDKTVVEAPLPTRSIEVQSIEKLNEMREMINCKDETQLSQYIQSISESGIQSKDDLLAFVRIIDSLPKFSILDGCVTWICFSDGISEDTGRETKVVFVTTEAENGDWVRLEYALSVSDASQEMIKEKASTDEKFILKSPVEFSDEDVTLHIEMRTPHPSGEGTMIRWTGEAKGIFIRIYYYTQNADNVKTEELFKNANSRQ